MQDVKRLGWVHFDSWAGRTMHPVEILGESAKRYKVRLIERALRHAAGKILYPPKHAVSFTDANSKLAEEIK